VSGEPALISPPRIDLGWCYAPALADPGPAPVRRLAAVPAPVDPGWISAQRRIRHRLGRPARLGASCCGALAATLGAGWGTGAVPAELALGGCLVAALAGLTFARSLRRGSRQLGQVLAAEYHRVDQATAGAVAGLAASHRSHASDFRAWQRRKALFDRQPAWFAVSLPPGIDRLDVAGGTLSGWSALVTTIAVTRLSLGGDVTVVDLTEGAVAADLVQLARGCDLQPLVWVLPADLPRLDLGVGLAAEPLADVLALAADASSDPGRPGDRGRAELASDSALLERVLKVLGPAPAIAALTAALRVLAQVGDPRADLRSGLLTAEQFDRLSTLFGRGGTDRMVIERAWSLESRLRSLDPLGSDQVPLPPSRLRLVALDRRGGVIGNRTVAGFLVAALTQLVRQAEPGRPWQHTICLLGADRLNGEVLDRLTDACEATRTGLVLGYRTIPASVRERLGRGNAAIAFMRLGNGDEAKAASELIGTEHRFVVGQLTDTVGTSITDTWGDSYTSTVGTADSVADSVSLSRTDGRSSGRGSSYQGGVAPFGDLSRSSSGDSSYSVSDQLSVSLTEGINSGTSWGLSLSRALGDNASFGRTVQRSRELLVEPDELQRLPVSAAIISYPAAAGRTVLLADANPAIATLPATFRRTRPDSPDDDDLESDLCSDLFSR
jgi:hypothetical protein